VKLSYSSSTLPEQQEIVHRAESFLTLANQLETRYQTARQVDNLTQAILAKAFRANWCRSTRTTSQLRCFWSGFVRSGPSFCSFQALQNTTEIDLNS